MFHSYKVFNLSFILWLSLPRFQGASLVYNEFVDAFLDRYHVEQKVDHRILTMKKTAKDAMWNIAKDVGWGFLYQVGGVVSYVQDSAASFVDQNTSSIGASNATDKSQHHGRRENGRDIENKKLERYHSIDNGKIIGDENTESVGSDVGGVNGVNGANNDANEKIAMNEEQSRNYEEDNLPSSLSLSSPKNVEDHSLPRPLSSRQSLEKKSQPIHSVLESYSSLSSLEADLALVEKEKYIHDFIDMLKKGLYVFSWCNNSDVINHSSSDSSDSSDRMGMKRDEKASKKYQLRVLKLIESNKSNTAQSFVLNPVESRLEEEGIDIISFAVSDISGVRESRRGIQFMTKVSTSPEDNAPSTASKGELREAVVAEVVLSDDQDKDILLFGLNIFLSKFCEKKSNDDLNGLDKATSKSLKRNNSFDTIDMK